MAMMQDNISNNQSQSGMMSSPKHKGYSGTVMYQGNPVRVDNGVAMVDGEKFIVSDDGRIVVNENRQFVGAINNGVFMPVTPELIDQYRQEGIFE